VAKCRLRILEISYHQILQSLIDWTQMNKSLDLFRGGSCSRPVLVKGLLTSDLIKPLMSRELDPSTSRFVKAGSV